MPFLENIPTADELRKRIDSDAEGTDYLKSARKAEAAIEKALKEISFHNRKVEVRGVHFPEKIVEALERKGYKSQDKGLDRGVSIADVWEISI